MKTDEVTLQNILKAYGKELKPVRPKNLVKKKQEPDKQEETEKLHSKEIDIVNYDKSGKPNIDENRKKSLIDFFQ